MNELFDKNWVSAILLQKIQNGRHFWRDKIFLKIGMATLQIYPVGQKFRRNRSI